MVQLVDENGDPIYEPETLTWQSGYEERPPPVP